MILGASGADMGYTQGFVPVGGGTQWQLKPAGVGALAPAVTVTNSVNVDWSTASIFQITGVASQTMWPLFVNQTIGQTIRLIVTQPTGGLDYVVWPGTTTFVGGTNTLSSVTAYVDIVDITCVAQSTFYGNMLKYVH